MKFHPELHFPKSFNLFTFHHLVHREIIIENTRRRSQTKPNGVKCFSLFLPFYESKIPQKRFFSWINFLLQYFEARFTGRERDINHFQPYEFLYYFVWSASETHNMHARARKIIVFSNFFFLLSFGWFPTSSSSSSRCVYTHRCFKLLLPCLLILK